MMSRLTALLLPLTAVLMFSACEKASEEPATPAPTAPGAVAPAETPATTEADADDATAALPEVPAYESLHDLMEAVDDHYKFLRRNADSAEPAEMLEHTAMLRALALAAKEWTPHEVEDAPEAEQAVLLATYHEHMDKVGPALDAVEAAVKSGDRAAAEAAIRALHEVEEHGHEALGVD